MARKTMVEVQCERCARKETQEPGALGAASAPPALVASLELPGATKVDVTFGDLCGPCQRTVAALFDQMTRKVEGISPDRTLRPKSANDTTKSPEEPAKAEPKAKQEGAAPAAPPPAARQAVAKSPAPPKSA